MIKLKSTVACVAGFALAPGLAMAQSALTLDGGPLSIVNLYSSPPANFFGASGAGAVFSFYDSLQGGALAPDGITPIDGQRAQILSLMQTQAGGSYQEYGMVLDMHVGTGAAIIWRPNQAYGTTIPGDIRETASLSNGGGTYVLAPNITSCVTSSTGNGPGPFSNNLTDGSCVWVYESNAGGSKVAIGLPIAMIGNAGPTWGGAIDILRTKINDPTTFTTFFELDMNLQDDLNHDAGTTMGDVYGIFRSGGNGAGTGTVADALFGGLTETVDGNGNPLQITSAGTGQTSVKFANQEGIFPNMMIVGATSLVPPNTFIGTITDNIDGTATATLISRASNSAASTPVYTIGSGTATITLQSYEWNFGYACFTWGAKQSCFTASSNSDYGFLDNASTNTYGAFGDVSGTKRSGFQASATSYTVGGFWSTGPSTYAGFYEDSTSPSAIRADGTYSGPAIDLRYGKYSSALALAMATNTYIGFKGGSDYLLGYDGTNFRLNVGGTTVWWVDPTAIQHAAGFAVGTTAGVSCTGTPTSSYAVSNGIVTHC